MSTRSRASAEPRTPIASSQPSRSTSSTSRSTGRPEDVAVVGRRWRDALDDRLGRDGSDPKKKDAEHEQRRANFSRTLYGIGILDGTFDTEGAEIIDTALRRCYERNHRADDLRTPAQQRADAIVDIFRHYLDHQDRGVNRPHLIVAVDGATLSGEAVGRCETLSGYQLHPDTVRRLACDAFIQRIVLDPKGVPLEMGRATRTFTPDQYRAIMIRDGGCRMPDCDAGPEDCQAHHTDYWENGGRTDLAVGLAVCRGAGHHRLIHEGGWTITGNPNGEITFHDPDGKPCGTSRPRNPPTPIPTQTGRDITRAQQRAASSARYGLSRYCSTNASVCVVAAADTERSLQRDELRHAGHGHEHHLGRDRRRATVRAPRGSTRSPRAASCGTVRRSSRSRRGSPCGGWRARRTRG